MIRWLLHTMTRKFEQRYRYDGGYMHEVFDISTSAGLRLSLLPLLSQYRGPNVDVWAGAALASVLDGDCGPCAQLVVDMALEAGADAAQLASCVQGSPDVSTATGLGYRFAKAAIEDKPEADALRQQLIERYGAEANVAAAFAAATSRAYPVLKRGLGHAASCQRLNIGTRHNIPVVQAA